MAYIRRIQSKAEALSWVGRKMYLGHYRKGGTIWTRSAGTLMGIEDRIRPDGSYYWNLVCSNDTSRSSSDSPLIRLTDGAPVPRPEGDNWVWAPTSKEAFRDFRGQTVELEGFLNRKRNRNTFRIVLYRLCLNPRYPEIVQSLQPFTIKERIHLYLQNQSWNDCNIDERGGVWIREYRK